MIDNRTILIVDDEPETLKGYAEFLKARENAPVRRSSRSAAPAPGAAEAASQGENFQLLLAKSGEEALETFKKEMAEGRRIAAGFFDVKLEGGMDGLTTIREIRKLDPEIHCVVVTAYHDRTVDEINELFGDEFKDQWDYLNKPFTQGEIVQKARQMTSAWNRRRKIEQMQAQLVASERMSAIGQLARGIGHEFGNILLRIMGKADLSLKEPDIEKVRANMKVVLDASERAATIVRNLQSFSKNQPLIENASLLKPLEQALSLMSHEFTKYNVKLEKDLKETPVQKIDSNGLSQVFLNLMINAIHAMPGGGTVRATIEPQAHDGRPGVAVKIADTGTGIPAEVLPRIFEYAFTTKGNTGSGLGLSVSREIVEAQGGAITVKTEVGKGTEFTVWVPQ